MKRCPQCGREYDTSMMFCLDDGAELLYGPTSEPAASAGGQFDDGPQTAILSEPGAIATGLPSEPPASAGGQFGDAETRAQVFTTDQTAILPNVHPHTASKKNTLIAAAIGIVLITALGLGSYWLYGRGTSSQINSIAVMPFENRNSDADTDYLSDGLAESVIFRLTQLPDLKVSPTSSVMRYKGKETDVAKIAAELGVDAVMTGRLTKRGDNLNITVELVDARTNKSLWGEQYERKLSELLTTQRDIVSEITNKLQVKLSGEGERKLAKTYTNNNEAYQLYLKGRFAWNKRTGESLKQAADLYKQAIDKDPGFALAYAGLAETYVIFPNFYAGTPKETMPLSKAAALRALELDDSLAEAHAALGYYLNSYEWDFASSEKELRRAIELNPKYATGHQWLGAILSSQKRFDEAIAEERLAKEIDPLSLAARAELGGAFVAARRYDDAISELNETLQLDANFYAARSMLGRAYLQKGMNQEAIAEFRKATTPSERRRVLAVLAIALFRTGQQAEATETLNELIGDVENGNASPSQPAMVYAALADKEKALAWIERTMNERWISSLSFAILPEFDDLHRDPRFKDLMKRTGLSE